MEGVEDISLKKRLGLELFRRYKKNEAIAHKLNYLFWECTLRCNLACKHCGSDCHKDMRQADMPLKDFLDVIDKSITPNVDTHKTMIVITGGEPLMRNDLEQCGKELYNREYPWGFVSNGLALSEKRLTNIINAGLSAVTISLDGLEEAHNMMRGNKDSFKQAFNAISLLTKTDIVFDVVTCVTSNTFSQLNYLRDLLIKTGVKKWRIFTVFPIGRAVRHQDLQLSPQQFKQLFDFIKNTRKEGRIDLSYGCEGFLGEYETEVRDHFYFCHAGINIGSILVDGSISACPNLRSNFTQGNIYKDDFWEVWSNRYQPFRNREWMKQDECKDCKHFRYCEGNGMHLRDENGKLLFCHLKRIKEGETGR